MIEIGFITSSLVGPHSVRGIGYYTQQLLSHMQPHAKDFGFKVVPLSASSQASPDTQLIHYPFFDLFYHSLPIYRHQKTIVSIHDVIPLEYPVHYPLGPRAKLNLALQKLALSSVEKVITDSYASVLSIRKYLNVPPSKISFVHLAPIEFKSPSPAKNASVRHRFHLPKKFVLYVGDINWNKNIINLFLACKKINVPLVLVGKTAGQIDTLDLSHAELSHLKPLRQYLDSPLLIRPGFVQDSDLPSFFKLASVYCQPSFAEGFGLGATQAMQLGCPVAVSHTPCLTEISGSAAVYFDPYSITDISQALSRVISDSRQAKLLVKSGLIRSSKFTWQQTALQTLKIYQEVLEQ